MDYIITIYANTVEDDKYNHHLSVCITSGKCKIWSLYLHINSYKLVWFLLPIQEQMDLGSDDDCKVQEPQQLTGTSSVTIDFNFPLQQ